MIFWYPNIKDSQDILKVLEQHSKYIEIQFPFSDPISDGDTIYSANQIALKQDISLDDYFDFIQKYSSKNNIIIMTYLNIIHNYGIEEFFTSAQETWIYWIIIPDLAIDTPLFFKMKSIAWSYDINIILSLSPNTHLERKKKIVKLSKGFVYAISQDMITWNTSKFGEVFQNYISELKEISEVPIGVWFGISKIEDIKIVSDFSDYVIIWSELIRRYQKWWISWLEKYLTSISKTLS